MIWGQRKKITVIAAATAIAFGAVILKNSPFGASDFQREVRIEAKGFREGMEGREISGLFEPEITLGGGTYVRKKVETWREENALPSGGSRFETVLGEPFWGSAEEHIPEKNIEIEEKSYTLDFYETVPALIENRTMEAAQEVVYEDLTGLDELPETAEATVRDPLTGQNKNALLPLARIYELEERWEDFTMEALLENPDEDAFLADGQEISWESWEREGKDLGILAQAAGLNPKDYQILETSWKEEDSEDGEACGIRKATETSSDRPSGGQVLILTGKRRVVDCRAVYEGSVALDPLVGQAVQAVYVENNAQDRAENGYVDLVHCRAFYYLK